MGCHEKFSTLISSWNKLLGREHSPVHRQTSLSRSDTRVTSIQHTTSLLRRQGARDDRHLSTLINTMCK